MTIRGACATMPPMLLLVLLGCRPIFSVPSDPTDDDEDTDVADTSVADGDTAPSVPTWWGVSGSLVLVDGAPDAPATKLALETRGELCLVEAAVTSAEPAPLDGALAAWTLELAPSPTAPCAWVGPTTVTLALGPTSPQQTPAARRAGWDLRWSLGLELGAAGAPRQLVGLAATAAMRAGEEAPPVSAPASGTWTLLMLHGIPLEAP